MTVGILTALETLSSEHNLRTNISMAFPVSSTNFLDFTDNTWT